MTHNAKRCMLVALLIGYGPECFAQGVEPAAVRGRAVRRWGGRIEDRSQQPAESSRYLIVRSADPWPAQGGLESHPIARCETRVVRLSPRLRCRTGGRRRGFGQPIDFRPAVEYSSQGVNRLGPKRNRPFDPGFGPWKDDQRIAQVDRGPWQRGAIRVAEPAIDPQQDHRPKLRICAIEQGPHGRGAEQVFRRRRFQLPFDPGRGDLEPLPKRRQFVKVLMVNGPGEDLPCPYHEIRSPGWPEGQRRQHAIEIGRCEPLHGPTQAQILDDYPAGRLVIYQRVRSYVPLGHSGALRRYPSAYQFPDGDPGGGSVRFPALFEGVPIRFIPAQGRLWIIEGSKGMQTAGDALDPLITGHVCRHQDVFERPWGFVPCRCPGPAWGIVREQGR